MNKAWVVDIFLGLPEEIQIYRASRFRIPDLVYFLSRIASGGYIITSFLFMGESITVPNIVLKRESEIITSGSPSIPVGRLQYCIQSDIIIYWFGHPSKLCALPCQGLGYLLWS